MPKSETGAEKQGPLTKLVTTGRNAPDNLGFVNPPIYHASTVLFPNYESFLARDTKYTYGRTSTPIMAALEEAIASLEGGFGTRVCPSGLSAIQTMMLSFLNAGDHVLITDSVYRPVRLLCDRVLTRLGIETTFYDPLIGGGISELIRKNTKLVYTECPGSQTFDMQDIPAIVAAAHKKSVLVAIDNTWSAGHYFKAFDHGCDISVQAGTKYIVGHSDVMLGTITVAEELWDRLNLNWTLLGNCSGPDDTYLALRGLRSLDVRLERHMKNGMEMATWLQSRPEVEDVLHPALPGSAGHDIWQRDFTGASSLFSVLLKPVPENAIAAFFNSLTLFGMGASWGGFESLAIPFDPTTYRTATTWTHEGQAVRFHIGLENTADLKTDLVDAFSAMSDAS